MPSHCFQPMPHGIHLVLGFDLALYSRSEDFHLLDCVHAAHTKRKKELLRSFLFIFQLNFTVNTECGILTLPGSALTTEQFLPDFPNEYP